MTAIGWDIGGVNTKVARVRHGAVLAVLSHPFEVQRNPAGLAPLLSSLAEQIGACAGDKHAVTMTAELSQMFRTKREGVAFVLDAVATALPDADIYVYTVDGRFIAPAAGKQEPLAVAASNWAATARVVAVDHPDAILIDIGTTTTDIIPIVDGRVTAAGTTDPTRLTSGELVYTGALRTPVEAIVSHVPLRDGRAGVSAETFALIADVHVWRGDLASSDYSVPTPDTRPATRQFARERLARVVCADRDLLDDHEITRIATAVADAQVATVARAIAQVRNRHPSIRSAVITGLGAFIAARAARVAGLTATPLADALGVNAARSAPAAAVALLLDRETHGSPDLRTTSRLPNGRPGTIVVKLGGGLLAHPEHLRAVLATIVEASHETRMVIVPGGGPFADAVRAADEHLSLGYDAAHWMAVLAMDQYAHLLGSLHADLAIVSSAHEVRDAHDAARVPVVAPYRWLRDADPLPHSWDVTSDSISAWIAGELHATRLVLVKPPGTSGAGGEAVVDPHFARARPPHIAWRAIAGDAIEDLRAELRLPAGASSTLGR